MVNNLNKKTKANTSMKKVLTSNTWTDPWPLISWQANTIHKIVNHKCRWRGWFSSISLHAHQQITLCLVDTEWIKKKSWALKGGVQSRIKVARKLLIYIEFSIYK